MNYNDKLQFLKKYRLRELQRQNIALQLSSLHLIVESAKTQQLSGMPISHKSNDLSCMMVILESLEGKLKQKQYECLHGYSIISPAIAELEDVYEQRIIQERYVEARSWEYIAEDIGYDRSTVFRKHKRAIKNLRLNATT